MTYDIDDDGNIKIKTILIGDSGVGKTNLINIIAGKNFDPNEESTINGSFFRKQFNIKEKICNIYIWDTIGQEKLKSLTKMFFKNAKIVILVYDISNKKSFLNLNNWINDCKEVLGDNFVMGICGNKTDLYLNEQVSEDECKEYSEKIGCRWILTSAKTDKVRFPKFLEELIEDYMSFTPKEKDDKEKSGNNNNKRFSLNKEEEIKIKKKKKVCFFF